MHDESVSIDRRAFLKRTVKTFATVLSACSVLLLAISSYPGRIRKKRTEFFRVCTTDDLPVRGVRQFYVEAKKNDTAFTSKVFIVNNGTEIFALSPVCTHLGCIVNWNRHKDRFLCPCHGGQYDMNGSVVDGPPPSPLGRLPLRTANSDVFIGLRI